MRSITEARESVFWVAPIWAPATVIMDDMIAPQLMAVCLFIVFGCSLFTLERGLAVVNDGDRNEDERSEDDRSGEDRNDGDRNADDRSEEGRNEKARKRCAWLPAASMRWLVSSSAMGRATVSATPPGGKGTIRRMGRSG